MPTYEYQCSGCSHRFEVFQSIKDEPLTECPKCAGRIKRVISPGAGVIFKGSGFYVTDNKGSSAAGGNGKKKTTSSEGTAAGSESAAASESPAGCDAAG